MTPEQAAALKLLATAVVEAIEAAGILGIPSGHLYARLMSKVSFDNYTAIIGALKNIGAVTEEAHILKVDRKRAQDLKLLPAET